MISRVSNLKDLIEDYEILLNEAEEMSEAWQHGDCDQQAASDPGLQYQMDMEIEKKYAEIVKQCEEIVNKEKN